ncbi:barstar family protein [Salinibacterium sp.]|uniref:barstar family protein n=1 Tax=Salinibacterium sp. TaxID=1915057 RepID=UPI00286AF2C7|nr:barstar family protein [Salinibacterium sp.]
MEESLRLIVLPSGEDELAKTKIAWQSAELTAITVRSKEMKTRQGLFDEFRAALNFPDYFGNNWNALSDCVLDLSWLDLEAGLVLVVTEPHEVLLDAEVADMTILRSILVLANEVWGRQVSEGEWWDRPALPFHVVLSFDNGSVDGIAGRWLAAGFLLTEDHPSP